MNFISIKSYSNYVEANIVLGRLQSEGINCCLMDENADIINPIWTNATHGIKLMVAEPDVAIASEIINQFNQEQESP